MKTRTWKLFAAALALGTFASLPALAQASPAPTAASSANVPEKRDGQHDFDFQFGKWKAHNRRLLHPLTGSSEWTEFDATIVAKPIWGGIANMDELEANTSTGPIHGFTVRTYNPASGQWSIYWANQKNGVISMPATVGSWDDKGVGTFYDQEDFNGRMIFVRYLWTLESKDKTHWEQAFSADGGKTWETNWIIEAERVKE